MTWAFPALFVVLWSTGFIGAKLGLPYADPIVFLELRFLFVLAILLPLCWLFRAPWPSPRRAGQMAVSGALLQAGYLGGAFASLHRGMPAGVCAVAPGMQPVLPAGLGRWLLRLTVAARQWLGFVLGMAGVLLVVGDRIVVESLRATAVGLSIIALVSITLGTLWQKRHGAGVDLRTGTAIQFVAAAVILAPFAMLEGGEVRWTGEFVFALGWLVVVLSFGAIFLLLTLIRRGRATQVSSLFYLVPPTTALIAWPLFGETYSLSAAAGMGLAMLAVWLVMKA